jgi:hypothetical protein
MNRILFVIFVLSVCLVQGTPSKANAADARGKVHESNASPPTSVTQSQIRTPALVIGTSNDTSYSAAYLDQVNTAQQQKNEEARQQRDRHRRALATWLRGN